MANTFEDLREIVMREIDEINKRGELDENSLVCVYKLVDIIKDINEIETGEEGGYAMAMNSRMAYPYYAMEGGGSYRGGNSGNSYARNSYANARNRDSMGRYSREGNSYGNSNRGGYSREGEREEIMAKMEHLMNTAASETERQMIQRIMNQL